MWFRAKMSRVVLAASGLLAGLALFAGTAVAQTPYAGLTRSTIQKPVLPRTIVLKEQGHEVSVTPTTLGWRLDESKIRAAAERKGLPLDAPFGTVSEWTHTSTLHNFFEQKTIPTYATFDQTAAVRQLTQLAAITEQAPVNAQIIPAQNGYTISPATSGTRIDVAGAVRIIRLALANRQTMIDLPITVVPPAVTDASLQPRLQQLKVQTAAAMATPTAPHSCADNPAGRQLILVSIGQQHLWACNGSTQVYDTPITSGAYLDGDATPTGTWHIYSKTINIHLIGPTWDDFVNYWMPFYSDYGFHDSSWQTFPYGSAQYASDGSHGCVHLPAAAMAWLYGWAPVGTTVTVIG